MAQIIVGRLGSSVSCEVMDRFDKESIPFNISAVVFRRAAKLAAFFFEDFEFV
jgi:hypothetical protein